LGSDPILLENQNNSAVSLLIAVLLTGKIESTSALGNRYYR
jgi:hypothetical protein